MYVSTAPLTERVSEALGAGRTPDQTAHEVLEVLGIPSSAHQDSTGSAAHLLSHAIVGARLLAHEHGVKLSHAIVALVLDPHDSLRRSQVIRLAHAWSRPPTVRALKAAEPGVLTEALWLLHHGAAPAEAAIQPGTAPRVPAPAVADSQYALSAAY